MDGGWLVYRRHGPLPSKSQGSSNKEEPPLAVKAQRTELAGAAKLIRALNHPLRGQLLIVLTEREASPNELANELGEGLSQTSYHIKVLRDLGLIELQRTEPRRGAVEHYYRASARPLLDNPEWAKLDQTSKMALSAHILQLLIGDSGRALSSGTFDSRDDRHLSRTPMLLDDEGFAEAAAVLDRALNELLQVQGTATARMNTSGEEGIQTIAGMQCFEVPPRKAKS